MQERDKYIEKKKQENEDSSPDDNDQSFSLPSSSVLKTLNMSLQELEESPIQSTSLQSKQYSTRKLKKIESSLKEKLFANASGSPESDTESPEESVLWNLKNNFSHLNNRRKKIMLLTWLPQSWSIRKIICEFNAPNYIVCQAKWLQKEKGILESVVQKPGKIYHKTLFRECVHFMKMMK